MPNAAPSKPNPLDYQVQRAIVLRSADADVVKLLKSLQEDTNRMLKEVLSRPKGIGRDIREAQLRLVQRNLHAQLADTWRRLGNITEARRVEAAARAAKYSQDENIFRLATGGVSDGGVIAENIYASELNNAASGLDRMIARTSGASYVPLKDRVYNSEVNIGSQVDRLVNSALARGLSAVEFAREVRGFINPATPGGVRYAAMRLARTEINNAAHAMAIQSVWETPWVEEMQWKLSGSHGRPDICDQYARGGPNSDGRYPKRAVPSKPHPQCLCYPISVTDDDEEFERKLLGGEYNQYLEKYRNLQPGQVVTTSYGGFAPKASPPAVVKTTKAVSPPKSKAVKPPTQAKPPTPGATTARATPVPSTAPLPAPPVNPFEWTAKQLRANRMIAEGNSLAKARNALAKEFNMTKEESERIVRQMATLHPNSAASRQSSLTLSKPTGPTQTAVTKPTPVKPPAAARVTTGGTRIPSSLPMSNELPSVNLNPALGRHLDKAVKMPPAQSRDDILAELRHQAELVPEVASRLSNVFLNTSSMTDAGREVNGYFQAVYRGDMLSREIHMSERVFRSQSTREQLRSEISGFKTSCGQTHTTGQSVFAHEFGHHLDYLVRDASTGPELKGLWDTISDAIGVHPPTGVSDVQLKDWLRRNNAAITREISGYATSSRSELLAEVWREYSGNPNARPVIRKIGSLLHKMAREVLGDID